MLSVIKLTSEGPPIRTFESAQSTWFVGVDLLSRGYLLRVKDKDTLRFHLSDADEDYKQTWRSVSATLQITDIEQPAATDIMLTPKGVLYLLVRLRKGRTMLSTAEHSILAHIVPLLRGRADIAQRFDFEQIAMQVGPDAIKWYKAVDIAMAAKEISSKTSAQMLYKNLPPVAWFKRNAEVSSTGIKTGDTLLTCFGAVYAIMKLCPVAQMTLRQAALLENMLCQLESQPGVPPAEDNYSPMDIAELDLAAILSNPQEPWFDLYRFATECLDIRHWLDDEIFQQGIQQHIGETGRKCLRDGTRFPVCLAKHAVDCIVKMVDAYYHEYRVSANDSGRKEAERKLRIALRSDAVKLASTIASTYT